MKANGSRAAIRLSVILALSVVTGVVAAQENGPEDTSIAFSEYPTVIEEITELQGRGYNRIGSPQRFLYEGSCGIVGCSSSYLVIQALKTDGVNPQSTSVMRLVRLAAARRGKDPEVAELQCSIQPRNLPRVGSTSKNAVKEKGKNMAHESQKFRANVGIAIVNDKFEVLALERAKSQNDGNGRAKIVGTDQWQMAQGGLDVGELPKTAAMRELKEELGLDASDVQLLFESPQWLAYELPEAARSEKHGRGQVQKWFFYRLVSHESNIDLSGNGEEQEFYRFEWMPLARLTNITWQVRRPVYESLVSELERYVGSL